MLRLPLSAYDLWLRRCHREGIDPDKAAEAVLRRALSRDGSLIGDGPQPGDDYAIDGTGNGD